MGRTGAIYVPEGCKNTDNCRLHIHFHGCGVNLTSAGSTAIFTAGFNEVAEAENIIILYP
jgi:poly(3-hydroxybutyrate) depolymerase